MPIHMVLLGRTLYPGFPNWPPDQHPYTPTPSSHGQISRSHVRPDPRAPSAQAAKTWTRSSRCALPHLRQLPPARSHILSQRAGLLRCRRDLEVPVDRRAPLLDDRQDLDALVPAGDAARRLIASMPRVAVDGNRECIAHLPSVRARDLVGRSALRDGCSHRSAMPIRLMGGQRAGERYPGSVSIPSEVYDDRNNGGRQDDHLDQGRVLTP